jgi:hypothetical protein
MKITAAFILMLILISMTASSQQPAVVRFNHERRIQAGKERLRLNDRRMISRETWMMPRERKLRKLKCKQRKNRSLYFK